MNCAQVKEQLVDFLYDELSPSLRMAFTEHLRGCPGCRAEVATHEKALGQARAALGGPLLQEAPARVHAAVLAAAQEAAAARKRPAKPARARPVDGRESEPGFFARFWRTPWLLPAFGAASVATALFLVKVLKNPEVLPGQKPRPVDELVAPAPTAAPAATAPVVAPPPAASPTPPPALGAGEVEPDEALGGLGRAASTNAGKGKAAAVRARKAEAPLRVGKGAATSGAPSRFAEPPPPRPATRSSRDIDDLFKSLDGRPVPAPADTEAAPPASGQKTRAPGDEDELRWDRAPATEEKHVAPQREYAAPPPARAPAPAPKASSYESGAGAPVPAGAPRPSRPTYAPPTAAEPAAAPAAPPSPSQAVRMKEAEGAAAEAPMESAAQRGSDAKRKAEAAKDKAPPSLAESIRKADRLFAAQDWTAASEAYRELLRRFPSHQDAPKWRERLSQSLVAVEEGRRASDAKAGKAAKAKTTETLLKEMK